MPGTLQAPLAARTALNKRFPGAAPQLEVSDSARAAMMQNPLMTGVIAASGPPPGMVANALAQGGMSPAQMPSSGPTQQLSNVPAAQPAPDPDSIMAQVTQHIAGQGLSPNDLDQRMAENVNAMHHLGRLLAKGDKLTRQDATQAAIDAVQAGAVSGEAASRFIDHMSDTPAGQVTAKLKGFMSNLMLATSAMATVKQQVGASQQQPAQPQQGA